VIVIVVVSAHCPGIGVNVYVVVAALFKAGDHVPCIPLFDSTGRALNNDPEHIGATGVNVGVMYGFDVTVTVIVVKTAHCPGAGLKIYVVVALLFKAGDHEPCIPLFESTGSGLMFDPEQIGPTCVNVGVMFASFTIIVIVVGSAHCPGIGVKVYVVVSMLFKAGDHEPCIPLFESTGSGLMFASEQIGPTWANVGVMFASFTMIVIVVESAHCPGAGVKV
jgi:hypothetical protein